MLAVLNAFVSALSMVPEPIVPDPAEASNSMNRALPLVVIATANCTALPGKHALRRGNRDRSVPLDPECAGARRWRQRGACRQQRSGQRAVECDGSRRSYERHVYSEHIDCCRGNVCDNLGDV